MPVTMDRKSPRTLVIVVTFNSMRWIGRCLGSVSLSAAPADVMVVDNASTDGTPEWIEDNFDTTGAAVTSPGGLPRVKLLRCKENLGFGAANNIGLRHALSGGYDYVYLLNSDAYLCRDTIPSLLESFEADRKGEFGVLSPMQMTPDGRTMDKGFAKWYGRSRFDPDPVTGIKDMPFVMAAHWMIPCSVVRKVGGFSPAFHLYGEDDNYLDRLRFHGWKAGVVPRCSAVHDRASRPSSRERDMRLKCISTVVKVSDPSGCFFLKMCRELCELVGMSLKNRSSAPLRFIPELLRRSSDLRACRTASRSRGAFL